jgi:hypothetical protein
MAAMKKGNLIGFAVLIAWLATLHILWPLPSATIMELQKTYKEAEAMLDQEKAPVASREKISEPNIEKQIAFITPREWIRWGLAVMFILGGILAGIAAIIRLHFWESMVALMSVLFLCVWVLQFQSADGPWLKAWLSAANAVYHHGSIASFMAQNLVLPVFHLGVIIALIVNGRQVAQA